MNNMQDILQAYYASGGKTLFENQTLLEYDTNITAQRQGPLLTARWLEDNSAKREVDGHSAKTPVEILEYLEYADPTKNKQYMLWIIKQYLAKTFMFEDIEGLKEEIEQYHTMKPRLPIEHRDIGKFDLGTFREMMMSYQDSGGDFELAGDVSEQDVDILVNSPQGVLARAKTEKGACEMGKGTKWCTASTDGSNFANSYIEGSISLEQPYGDGLFIYWEYPGKKKYQIHFGDDENDEYDEYSDVSSLPSITVMDAQDQTVFNKDPDWLIKRQTHPVLGGLIKAMQNHYNVDLKHIDMFGEIEDDDYGYNDNIYSTFFDSWRKLFGTGKDAKIEEKIMKELGHVIKADIEASKKGIKSLRDIENRMLDMDRFKFAFGYLANIRGERWPQMEQLMISEFNTMGKILSSDEEIFKKFITKLNRPFIEFRDQLKGYVQQGMLSKAVTIVFEENFLDKFKDPSLIKNKGEDVFRSINTMWGKDFFDAQLSNQKRQDDGVDIKTIPKLPPVPLQKLPTVELFKHVELKTPGTGFTTTYQSVFTSKGNFNREANIFDKIRYSITPLYEMTVSLSRDLPGVSFFDDVKYQLANPGDLDILGTANSPLLSKIKKQLESAGLDENQVQRFVSGPAGGVGRDWAWSELDMGLIFLKLYGSRDTAKINSMTPEQSAQIKEVYKILGPYMYKLDDKFYDTIVNNLKSSPLGKIKNSIMDQMYEEILDLKNDRGILHDVFKTADRRCVVAGEQFANLAGQPVQFNDAGFETNVGSGSEDPEDTQTFGNSLDYVRRAILQKEPGFADLKLIAPDVNDPQTKKIYQKVSTEAAKLSFNQAHNYEFDKPRTDADIKRFNKLYRKFT